MRIRFENIRYLIGFNLSLRCCNSIGLNAIFKIIHRNFRFLIREKVNAGMLRYDTENSRGVSETTDTIPHPTP